MRRSVRARASLCRPRTSADPVRGAAAREARIRLAGPSPLGPGAGVACRTTRDPTATGRCSMSPSACPRPSTGRISSGPSWTRRRRLTGADLVLLRYLRGELLDLVGWAGFDDATAAALAPLTTHEPWLRDALAAGRAWVCDDVRELPTTSWTERFGGGLPIRGDIFVPLVHGGRLIGSLTARRLPRVLDAEDVEIMTALGVHAALALRNAELFERLEARAAQMAVVQAASARMNHAKSVESVGRAIVEEIERDRRLPQRPGLHRRGHRRVHPDRVRGQGRRVRDRRLGRAPGQGRRGLHRLGRRERHAALHPRRERGPARGPDPGDGGRARIDARGADAPRRCRDGRDHALEARPQPVQRRRPPGPHDPRRPGGHGPRVGAPARPDRVDGGRAAAPPRDEPGSVADARPKQVGALIARHLAVALGVDACAISSWDVPRRPDRLPRRVPGPRPRDAHPIFQLPEYPETRRVLETQATVIVDAEDPSADPAEVAILREEGLPPAGDDPADREGPIGRAGRADVG